MRRRKKKKMKRRKRKKMMNDFLKKLGENEDEKGFIQRRVKTEGNIDMNESIEKKRLLNLPDFSINKKYKKKKDKKEQSVIN